MSDYTPTSRPVTGSWNTSKVLRDEFVLVATAVNSKADSYGVSSVSTTSLTIADVLQTFTMETGKEFVSGMNIYIGDAAAPSTNYMLGMLTSYDTVTGLSAATISSHVGSGTKTSWIIGLSNSNGATLVNNAFTGHQDFARATVASAATTADIWSALGNQINFTGTATVTGFPAALQAGASRELICAGACVFTAGANMLIDGIASGASVTCAANDIVIVRAVTLTQFRLTRQRYDGKPQREIGSHKIVLHTGNGHGSTGTKIRRLTTALVNTGTAMTYADSATAGMSITINEDGTYSFAFGDANSGGDAHAGITVNAPVLTDNITSSSVIAYRLGQYAMAATGDVALCSIAVKLSAGDVVRAHTNGANDSASDSCLFRAEKIGNA